MVTGCRRASNRKKYHSGREDCAAGQGWNFESDRKKTGKQASKHASAKRREGGREGGRKGNVVCVCVWMFRCVLFEFAFV